MSYAATILADTPAGFWRFNESSGLTAADSSGNAIDGTYVGLPTLGVASPIGDGTAVTFNGTAQYVTLPSNALLNIAGDITLEAWVKTTGTGASVVIDGIGSPSSTGYALAIGATSAGKFDFWNGVTWYPSTSTIHDGSWHHIVVALSGTTLKHYIDGVMDKITMSVSAPVVITIGGRAIAVYYDFGGNFYGGTLDEPAVYASGLSAARVAAHYDARNSLLTGTTFDGASSTVGTGRVDHALSGDVPGVATAVAAAKALRPLAGAVPNVGTATAHLRLADEEHGSSHGVSHAFAHLRSSMLMAGSTRGTSDSSACGRLLRPVGLMNAVPLVTGDGMAVPSIYDLPFGIVMDEMDVAQLVQLVDCG